MVTHDADMAAYAKRIIRFLDGIIDYRGGKREDAIMLRETILLALREIRRNLMRSSLTILGIVIGVAAVITMVTLGRGATAQVTSDITKLGTNLLQIRPGQHRHGPGGTQSTGKMFKADDADAIAREISGLAAVAPMASQTTQAIYGNENWVTSVIGSTRAYLQACNWQIESGRQFTDSELRGGKGVCILGATVRKELFGGQNPLGTRFASKSFHAR